MRVLYVINSLGSGGAERELACLLEPLSGLGVESYVATLLPAEANAVRAAPFMTRYEPGLLTRGRFGAVPRLARLASEVDLVHTHLPWSDITGRLAAVIAQKPVVSTFHSTWYDPHNLQRLPTKTRQKVQFIRMLDASTVRSTSQLFAPSNAVREVYSRALGLSPERILVIHNAIDLREFDPCRFGDRDQVRADLGMAPEEVAIAVVARFDPQKDHATAIAAAGNLAKEQPLRLYLVGFGPLRDRLHDLAQAHGTPVTFLGPLQDVPRLLFASDLFILPTYFEAYSLALMEAMAMGLPCVSSDIPENREVGEDAVVYAPPGDVAALTCRLRELLDDSALRDSLSRQARARAKKFDVSLAAPQLFAAYQKVLRDRHLIGD